MEQIKRLRAKHDISQEELARLLGATWPTISRWERGVAEPSPDGAERLRRLVELGRCIGDALPKGELARFLSTPTPALRGHEPRDLLGSAYAFEDLLDFAEAAKSGDMA